LQSKLYAGFARKGKDVACRISNGKQSFSGNNPSVNQLFKERFPNLLRYGEQGKYQHCIKTAYPFGASPAKWKANDTDYVDLRRIYPEISGF
jgi:hypothetical protein